MDDSATILDAGHYQISSTQIALEGEKVTLPARKDRAYLITTKPGKALSDINWEGMGEFRQFSGGPNKTTGYILMRPNAAFSLSPVQCDAIADIQALDFPPSDTELGTLRYGLSQSNKPIHKVAILVGDVGLPSEVTRYVTMFVPESYRALLAKYGDPELLLVSERQMRNKVSKPIDQKIRAIKTEEAVKVGYDATGFMVCANEAGQLALVRTMLDDVPLGGASPSCAAKSAGMQAFLRSQGFLNVVSVYDSQDDPLIEAKKAGGTVIDAWLHPEENMATDLVILDGGKLFSEERYETQSIIGARNIENYASTVRLLKDNKREGIAGEVDFLPVEDGKKLSISSGEGKGCATGACSTRAPRHNGR